MKVLVENGQIKKMDQDIPLDEAIGEFGMMIKFNSASSKKLFEMVKLMLEGEKINSRLVDALNMMVEQGIEFVPYYFEEGRGIEVDTLDDLKESEVIVKRFDDEETNPD